ncbi:MAG: cell division protein FtsQ/DivIB [Candidatus Omnitrophica bacterium]|nr:cell division protein FtsQ/DivIB [Candidatus Omnitrophota bacterium]
MARRKRKLNQQKIKYIQTGIIGVFVVFVGFVLFNGMTKMISRSGFFIIREVEVAPSLAAVSSRHLNRLKGKNIFRVNLNELQKRIQSQYPYIDQLRVLRKFPDKIYVDAIRRDPFARIGIQGQDVLVDEKGIVLSVNPQAPFYREFFAADKVPGIVGIPANGNAVVGKAVLCREAREALRVLKVIKKNEYLRSYKVKSVDVTNLSEMVVHFRNGLKIILDRDKVTQKVKQLGILLSQGKLDLKATGYIDLRFKEPVLGEK